MNVINLISSITWLAAICFLSGFIFVVLEMYIPGFGLTGVTGGVLLIIGILLTAKSFMDALILIVIIMAILGITLTIVLQSAAKGKLNKSLVLNDTLDKASGYIGTEDLEYFLGREGISMTTMRPSGTADFDGVKLDVVTDGEFVKKDTKVRIVKVQGRRIVVKSME